ncbi:MAG: hypothetical protein ACXWQO_20185, partial [Bdellovibrionota bacterium]
TCACDLLTKDLLEEPIRFAFGKFQGACVDSCRFRRARVLQASPQFIQVGNILHLGHYSQAKIRLDQVENVEVGFERFAPGVDHVILRFTFRAPISLLSQDGHARQLGFTRSLVISSEGVPPKAHPYSLSEGFWGHYLLAHRLITGDELDQWIAKLRHPLRLIPLQVEAPKAADLLARGIKRSDLESFRSVYRLFANNCSTSALALLDAETGYHGQNWDPIQWEEWEAALPIAGPLGTEHALGYRGLIRK